ncbi:DNA methyltransferase [Salinibacterium sp. TMP30]|uniref:DNA methyltransferase n=1 Tax=Salinibacterium sp. TMP30 TaxID=3138237 RepID=UPI003138F30E
MPDAVDFSLQSARAFADKYASAKSEKQLAQSYWRDFFGMVCGIDDLLATGVEFEQPVKSAATGMTNFVDVLWPGVVLVEHKTAGKDLDKAETQARDYLVSLPLTHRTPVIIVSDFAHIRIVEVLAGRSIEFSLTELPDHLHRIEAIVGNHAKEAARPEVSADIQAVQLMADLFLAFEKAGYSGHEVSVFLVRVLFLLFGDDTRMWKRVGHGLFAEFISDSSTDGIGLGGRIQELFQVLDTPPEKRPSSLNPRLTDFPYVNGGLFSEYLHVFSFTEEMRDSLVNASAYDWSKISPAIFGSMFQTIKSKEDRRALGEHYTSEANILKVIRPLFLDDYLERLRKAWESPAALKRLRSALGVNHYLDPACGPGNFLVVAYKRLRDIELKIVARLQELGGTQGQVGLDGSIGLQVHLSQFHGIEYEEWSSQIATVAMFLADHQANLALDEITGAAPNRFPITDSSIIVHDNALQVNWAEVCPMDENTVIMGNPPFYGSFLQSPEQKADTVSVWKGISGSGNLDYVANWYLVAARHIASTGGRAAFVSTNSVTQGQQPAIIWGQINPLGVAIDFAHRTFSWTNEASGKAAVHCVIIGFSARPKPKKLPLWNYPTVKGDPELGWATQINAYLLDAPNTLITARRKPLHADTQPMDYGSKPTDGGSLSNISSAEADYIKANDPVAAKYLRRLVGARELIHNDVRFCLWLVGASPADLRTSPTLATRIKAVRALREASPKKMTQQDAERPSEFQEIRQPTTNN